MSSRANKYWLGAAALGVAALIATVAVFLSARDDPKAESPPAPAVSAADAKIIRELKSAWDGKAEPKSPKVAAADKARCQVTDETETADEPDTTPNAILSYRNYVGEEPDGDVNVNIAYACFYATGRSTDLGFNNTVADASFGLSKGVGDFVAFTAVIWDGNDGADDGFHLWNLRTGKQIFDDESCSSGGEIDCTISDIDLSRAGSIAYVACRSEECLIFNKEAGHKRTIVARYPRQSDPAVTVHDRRLYWLEADGETLGSSSFK